MTVTVTEIIVRNIRKALARARKTAMSESKPREYSKEQSGPEPLVVPKLVKGIAFVLE